MDNNSDIYSTGNDNGNTITCEPSNELVYTELHNYQINPSQGSFASLSGCITKLSQPDEENESQYLAKYFLGDVNDLYQVSIPDPGKIITDRIDSECNGLPKESFISSLLDLCKNDTETIEQLRLFYFKTAKSRNDFPYETSSLKRRIHPKTKHGESLLNKLGRDCYVLRLASQGEYCDELKDALSSRSANRNLSCVENEVNDANSLSHPYFDSSSRDKLIQLESIVHELKSSNSQMVNSLSKKLEDLHTENKKLASELNKQKDRNINIQNQMNSIRNKNIALSDNLKTMEHNVNVMNAKVSELVHIHERDVK